MGPLVPGEAGDAPEPAKRFDGTRTFYTTHVLRLPTELVQYHPHGLLRIGVVPTDEHRGLYAIEVGSTM